MKVTIPEQLKSAIPQTQWGKILTATPVIMTVIATMLAGLASSEMTRAQYDRALGAQLQSKAGDQWSFFQAKRVRAALQRNTVDLLQINGDLRLLDTAMLQSSAQAALNDSADVVKRKNELGSVLASQPAQQAIQLMNAGQLPAGAAPATPGENIRAAMEGVENSRPETEIWQRLEQVSDQELEAALRTACDRVQEFDAATKPINQAIDQLDSLLAKLRRTMSGGPQGQSEIYKDFAAARFQYTAQRYEAEARLNQAVANIYELQVRKSNHSAERHHARSQRFFFGMLAAQAAVIIATFAIAARQRNLLWSLAAFAGIAAIALAIYVYLYV